MATPPKQPLPPRRYERLMAWLGGPNSWRRIMFTGVVAGVVLAFSGAMIAGFLNGGDLDGAEAKATPNPISSEPIDAGNDGPEEQPVDAPPPVEEVPTDVPTEVIEESTAVEELPTEVPSGATPTAPVEVPTEVPTVGAGG